MMCAIEGEGHDDSAQTAKLPDDHYNERDDELATAVYNLFETLAQAERRVLLQSMSAAVAHHDRTGHVDPLIRFARSVRASTHLRLNADYLHAVKAADAAPMGQLESVEDVVTRARERRAR